MNRIFSHSSLSTFELCPARFKFIYLDKISNKYEGIESFVGRRVHETLQFLYQEEKEGRVLNFDTIEDYYFSSWEANFHEGVKVIKSGYRIDYYKFLGRSCISKYFRKSYIKSLKNSVKKREIEYTVIFKLHIDDDFEIKGIIDRLDYISDKDTDRVHLEIHDYKTSSRLLSQKDANEKDRQLALYQIGLQKNGETASNIDLVWHFLQFGKIIKSKRSPAQLEKLTQKTRNLIYRIMTLEQEGKKFLPLESSLCNWCFYWDECEAKSHYNPVVNRKTTT